MKVAIIGAGMSGLCMGIALRRLGIEFVILEKSPELGGTWWENTYPGCACDIPSHLYGFSFAPEPGFTRVYPGQAEILAYLHRVADRFDLRRHVRLGVAVLEARWDEARARWRLRTSDGDELVVNALVSAVGPLHVPKYPALPGLDTFQGPAFHSARWDHDRELRGKRVGVIGNAASAVQLVPHVAQEAQAVYVFQRTAHWVLPKYDGPYPPSLRRFFRAFPPLLKLYRWLIYLQHEAGFYLVFDQGSAMSRRLRRWTEKRIRELIRDPAVQDALIPDYQPGCKRILLSNDYYQTLDQDHVHLVCEALRGADPEGLITDAGRYDLDVLVYATGFTPMALGRLEVTGRDGERMTERLASDPRAYLGITLPGFPNHFTLLGPNTGLGHNSVVWMVECQVNYVARCLTRMRRAGLASIEVTRQALDAFYEGLNERMSTKVWTECSSWYRNADGLVYAIWPWDTARYWWRTRRPNLRRDYVCRPLGAQSGLAPSSAGRQLASPGPS